MSSNVEVVISGIGGIFPNCLDLNDFKELLLQNIVTAEQAKWIHSEADGNSIYNNMPLKREVLFDATFFGTHRSQVRYLDPLGRLFLEKTFEAIIDAGINPADLRGKNIPVLVGSTVSETDASIFKPVRGGFGVTGQARSMISNRVSYWLNTSGQSVSVDANWTSGIQLIEMAMAMIQSENCDEAIIGCANCSEHNSIQWLMKERGLVSKDGVTRPFDEQADGYLRGDGVVVLFLQRADLAKRNYASVLRACTIFNGNQEGDFSYCDSNKFQDFIRKCYTDSGVSPKDVSYLETHGCGVKSLDEAELRAVEGVFCTDRSTPLQIGSVKTNIGHAEPVSALMSLIKIIIAMETGVIPAHLNFNQPNKNIPGLSNGKIEVVTKNKEWNGEVAAINCIGIGSSFGHMIVRRNKQQKVDIKTDLPLLLTYSTRTTEGIEKIEKHVQSNSLDLCYNYLVHDVYSSNIPGNLYRGYTMMTSTCKTGVQNFSGNKPAIWFVYSGMGSQWHTMGRDLMKLPVFAEAIMKCHNILESKGMDLLRIITDDDSEIFENIMNSFVGIAAVQIGLTDVLNAVGIQPDGIIGHSVGELGCAYADKCLTAEQMILSAYYRGKASLDVDLPICMMAAIGMGHTNLQSLCPPSIDIACHNSVTSCTISGPIEDVTKFVEKLKADNIFAKLVNVSNIAYHSRYIKPAAPFLLSYLKKIIPDPKIRSSKWVSTSVPQSNWDSELARTVSPEYLTNNLLSSVLLEETLSFIPKNAVAIEIAPHGLLQAILKRALPSEVVNIALTKRDTNNLEFLFNSLGQLYLNGLDFNLNALYPPVPQPVPVGTSSLCSLVQWEHGEEWELLRAEAVFEPSERTFHINLMTKEFDQLNHYKIDNRIFIPAAMCLGFVNEMINKDGIIKDITFENVIFKNHVEITPLGNASISVMILTETGYFEVNNKERNIVTGTVIINKNETLPSAHVDGYKDISNINQNNFYKELNIKGYQYPNEYKLVSSLNLKEHGLEAKTIHSNNWKALMSTMIQTHLFFIGDVNYIPLLPTFMQRVNISFNDFEDTTKESTIWFNNSTNILESNMGIHITGIQYKPLKTANNALKIENLNFLKHVDENILGIEYGLNMVTKIVTENVGTENLIITEIKDKYTATCLLYIEKYLNQKELNAVITEINEIDYNVLQESSLTIISGSFLNITSNIISNGNNFFLLCFPNNHSICMPKKYSTIVQFSANNKKFYLLKKTTMSPVKVINISEDKLCYNNMQTNSIPWTSKLNILSRDDKKSRLYIVSRIIPNEGITEFVTQIQNLVSNRQNLRFMFILDPNAPECRPEVEFYTRVFEQDLVVQVLKNGSWGSFVDILETSELYKTNTYSSLMHALNSNDLADICHVNYLGLHTKDLTRIDDDNVPCEMGAVDFAGTTALGDKVMGFAQTDLEHCKLAMDPAFVWPVPVGWSLSDAATVPYAYTLAYYALFIVGNISNGDAVLVHAGCSEVGLAALHVAYDHGYTVYTTVANNQQKVELKKFLPGICDENILNSETTQFELGILNLTKGRGVDIILNCLPGERLQVTKCLLGLYSRFIQLGSADLHQNTTTGMRFFVNCCSFHGLNGQHLLQIDQEVKRQIHDMISRDIQKTIVVPIRKRIITENRIDESLRYLRSSTGIGAAVIQISKSNYQKAAVIKNSVFGLQNKDSYLIYADSQDIWVSLVQWLVKQSAKRIYIASHSQQNQAFVNRISSVIKHTYDVEIVITKHNASTLQNAKSLAKEVNSDGSIKEIFIFETDDKKIFENIDVAFSENKQNGRMVCILGINKEYSYFRANGLPVCNIMWDDAYSFQDVIKNLDVILTKGDKMNVLLKNDVVESEETMTADNITEDDPMFLPYNLKTLKLLGQNDLKAADIIQLTSLAPKKLREISAVFLVPGPAGPDCPDLRQFIGQLMYPVFCVQLPATSIPDDIVAQLAQQILQVQQCKVYKLIGVSWGGILATEIAKYLENLGLEIELLLIDENLKVIQNFTSNFYKTESFDMELLKQIINVDGKSVENILASADLFQSDYNDIVKSLSILKSVVEYFNSYKSLQNQVNGQTTVILPENANIEECVSLREHCRQIQYEIVGGNHRAILHNRSVIEFINDTLA